MPETVRPHLTTQPPSSLGPCAYAYLLDRIADGERRQGNLALATAMALEDLDPSCRSELAERLYDAVRYSR